MQNEILQTPSDHTKGGVRELLTLVLPIFTLLFTPCLVGFFERIFLSRYSLEALEGSMQALYVLQIFQFPLINFANMTQVFVGKHLGAGESEEVGHCVWQMAWISLLSMLLIVPLGMLISPFFLKGVAGEIHATTYFNTLLGATFLFPLGAALSSFYLVQERIYFMIKSTFFAYGLMLFLESVLILGIPHILPPLGTLGASLSMGIGRLLFCMILFICFLKQPYLELYQTNRWKIDFHKIRTYLRVCAPRAGGRVFALLAWAFSSHFMAIKGGYYPLVLSIGGTLILFCYFFTDSLIQALTVIFSRYLGAKHYQEIWKSWRAGLFLVLLIAGTLSIPFLIFPDIILSFFFKEVPTGQLLEYLHNTLYGVWGWGLINNLAGLFLPLLLARQDTLFYIIAVFFAVLTSAIPVYFFIYRLNWAPDKFWLILIVEQFVLLCLYAFRTLWLQKVSLVRN